MLRLKPGVDLSNIHPKMVWVMFVVERIYDGQDLICTVTAGKDGQHQVNSLHYAKPLCRALDFRTRMVRRKLIEEIIAPAIRRVLGPDFDVVVHIVDGEVHHLHIEYQPNAI